RGRPCDETPRTARRVPSETVGRGLENVAGDAVSFPLGLEDFDGERGHVAFAGGLSPGDQVVGLVELERAEQSPSQLRPSPIAIEIMDHRLERAQADLIAAPFVAEDVPPAANLHSPPVSFPAEAARTRAAEHQDAGQFPVVRAVAG